MLRIEVSEEGRAALPAIDLADEAFVIGSNPSARIRLPAAVARAEHVTIDRGTWRSAEGSGALGDGHVFTIGTYRVRVSPAPAGAQPTPPQRTESLARELVRDLLGASGAPMAPITIETINANTIACTAARAAPSGFCSPMRRAIIAIAPMLSPIASA